MKNERETCKICGKKRVLFFHGMCQTCYKKKDKKRFYVFNDEKYNYKNLTLIECKIVDLRLQTSLSRKDIAKKTGYSYSYVCQILQKYTKEVDMNG